MPHPLKKRLNIVKQHHGFFPYWGRQWTKKYLFMWPVPRVLRLSHRPLCQKLPFGDVPMWVNHPCLTPFWAANPLRAYPKVQVAHKSCIFIAFRLPLPLWICQGMVMPKHQKTFNENGNVWCPIILKSVPVYSRFIFWLTAVTLCSQLIMKHCAF